MAKSIGLVQLQRLIGAGAQLLEVLPEAEFREAHLPRCDRHPAQAARRAHDAGG